MGYDHIQRSPLYLLVLVPGVGMIVAGLSRHSGAALSVVLLVTSLILVLLAFCFRYLRVRDVGEQLLIQYGPIPLFWRRIDYARVREAVPSRSSVLDGWGIHWTPFRGVTYNLWGFGCVKLRVGSRVVRIGTDDLAGLAEFLNTRIPHMQ